MCLFIYIAFWKCSKKNSPGIVGKIGGSLATERVKESDSQYLKSNESTIS